MAGDESRPSPGEDRRRGHHGGDGWADKTAEAPPGRSSQAAGKDPGRSSRPEPRSYDPPRETTEARDDGPDLADEQRPPNWRSHHRGWREGDPEADSVAPGREAGAAGGVDDGPEGHRGPPAGRR
jgi:hypothetical protein